jgi:hypothetical protein
MMKKKTSTTQKQGNMYKHQQNTNHNTKLRIKGTPGAKYDKHNKSCVQTEKKKSVTKRSTKPPRMSGKGRYKHSGGR